MAEQTIVSPVLENIPSLSPISKDQVCQEACCTESKAANKRIIVLIIDCRSNVSMHTLAFAQYYGKIFDIRPTCFHGSLTTMDLSKGIYCQNPSRPRIVKPIDYWMCCRRFVPYMFHVITALDIQVEGNGIENIDRLVIWTDGDPQSLIARRWWWWNPSKMIAHTFKDIYSWNPLEFDQDFVPLRRSTFDSLVVNLRRLF